jgi:hypothetical protein
MRKEVTRYRRASACISVTSFAAFCRGFPREAVLVSYLEDPSHRKTFSVVMTFLRMVTKGGSCLAMNPDGTIRGCH